VVFQKPESPWLEDLFLFGAKGLFSGARNVSFRDIYQKCHFILALIIDLEFHQKDPLKTACFEGLVGSL